MNSNARHVPDLPILSVSQLTQAIKLSLEATFPLVCVEGEMSNFKRQASGHLYFSLKDNHAQITAVMFRGEALHLRHAPKDGDHIVVRAELNVYPPRGGYQLVIREMHLAGLGELLLKLEALKQKLHQSGWFDVSHKKSLPRFPRKIGVVTSPTGAVIQDIINVLTRRYGCFHLVLNPVKVQGDGAAQEIAHAINEFNAHDLVDVIIVARGGGSIEDLWAFNEEIVASAIFHSRIPIISAVGHETDVTIADLVADVRAPTPSAAAELVIAEREHHITYLEQCGKRMIQALSQQLKGYRQRLKDVMRQPVLSSPSKLLGSWMQRLDDIRQGIDQYMEIRLKQRRFQLNALERQAMTLRPSNQIRHLRQRLTSLDQALQSSIQLAIKRRPFDPVMLRQRLNNAWTRTFDLRIERLRHLQSALESIDPKKLLRRGFSILFSEKDGSIINSVQVLQSGAHVKIMLSDGSAKAMISETEAH